MSTSRPLREQRRADAEHRLLVAAAELVGELGPSNVTLAEVGERAGYSRGLATHHFGSKGALMDRLVEVVSHQLLEDFARAATGDSLADELLGLTRVYFDSIGGLAPLARARLALWAVAVATPTDGGGTMLATDRAFRREIEQRVRRRIAAGEAPTATDPAALATVMVAMLRGVALQSVFDDEIDVAAARKEIEHMINDRTRYDAADGGGRDL
jgi:AcrR family transcriptional regulator